jgi:hypothetical protein
MRKEEKAAFEQWAIAHRKDPISNPSSTPSQALAIQIHNKMRDGQWRTTSAIAKELKASLTTVQGIMWSIKEAWGYEAIPSRNKGYRRIK